MCWVLKSRVDRRIFNAFRMNMIHVCFIKGFLSLRPPPRNSIGTLILQAVQFCCNLNAVQISPRTRTFPTATFPDILCALKTCSSLCHLTVNSACQWGGIHSIGQDWRPPLSMSYQSYAGNFKYPSWLAVPIIWIVDGFYVKVCQLT
jgi:hypothetical protein